MSLPMFISLPLLPGFPSFPEVVKGFLAEHGGDDAQSNHLSKQWWIRLGMVTGKGRLWFDVGGQQKEPAAGDDSEG
jgi:hypothetical protein